MLIFEMEAKGETPKDKRVIHPAAGFVVKTKKEDGAKLFINVVSSDQVEQPTSTTVNGGSQWQLPHLLGPPRMERDKKDNSVGAFDCCFHPLALQHAENARPFRDLLVSTAIDAVERSYKNQNQPTKLSRTYHVLLGVKYKTGPPQALMVASVWNQISRRFSAYGIAPTPSTTPARWRGGVGLVPPIQLSRPHCRREMTLWRIIGCTRLTVDFRHRCERLQRQAPARKQEEEEEEEEEEAEGPSFADNIRGSLKSQRGEAPARLAKPPDDQPARARKLLEKANKAINVERGGDA